MSDRMVFDETSGRAFPGVGRLPEEDSSNSSSARASAQNVGTSRSSGRMVGAARARANSWPTSTSRDFKLDLSILRRCPNAADVTRSRDRRLAGANGGLSGVRPITADVTFGGGTKGCGGNVKVRGGPSRPLNEDRQAAVRLRAGPGDETFRDFLLKHESQPVETV